MSPSLQLAYAAFGMAVVHGLLLEAWSMAVERAVKAGRPPATEPEGPLITVAVPARNAEATVVPLLQDLHAQDLPKARYEVLVVDDHSTDATAARVSDLVRSWPQARCITNEGQGKKAALATAVHAAKGEWLLFTDADVRCGPGRLSALDRQVSMQPLDMVIMPVSTVGGAGFWAWLQRKEQAALQVAALGSALWRMPVLANGANLAVRRSAFLRSGGFSGDRWASGDDMFLLQRFKRMRAMIGAIAHPDAAVWTAPEDGLRGAFQQRIRWAGKMWAYRDLAGSFAALLAVAFPWVLLLLTGRAWQAIQVGQGAAYTVLFLASAWVLWAVPVVRLVRVGEAAAPSHLLRSKADGSWSTLPALLMFTLYAPVIAILSIFVRPHWKGRRIGAGFST